MGGSSRWRVSGSVGDGFVLLEPRPLARGVVHFEDGVHQHCGAAGAVGFGQNLGVLAQLDLDDVALLRTWVLCATPRGRTQSSTRVRITSTLRFDSDSEATIQLIAINQESIFFLRITVKPSALYSFIQSRRLFYLLLIIKM